MTETITTIQRKRNELRKVIESNVNTSCVKCEKLSKENKKETLCNDCAELWFDYMDHVLQTHD